MQVPAKTVQSIWRAFAANAAMILGSRVTFGLLNLATNALAIRVFGLAELGIVLLLQAYTRIFSDIVKFQSWQAILRFGAASQERDDTPGLRRLLGFAIGLDLAAFAVSIAGAVVLIPWAADWFGWPEDVTDFAPLFVLSIVFITHATPNGFLRLVDRVDALAIQFALNASLRFLLVGASALAGGGVLELVMAWFAASVISGCYVFIVTGREMIRHHLLPDMRARWTAIGAEHSGIWRFLVMQNVSTGLALIVTYGTTVVVGGQIGPAAAAIWEIARQFGGALTKPAKLLGPLLFPELSRMAARGDWVAMRSALLRQMAVTASVLSVVVAVLLFFLPALVTLIFGDQAGAEAWLFRFVLLGAAVSLCGFLMEPAFLSANKPGTLLLMQIAAILSFVLVATLGYPMIGLTALGLGLLGYHIAQQTLMVVIGRRLLKKRIRRGAARAAQQSGEDIAPSP